MSGELTISAGISAYEISGCTTLLSGSSDGDCGHEGRISLIIGAWVVIYSMVEAATQVQEEPLNTI